MGGIGQVTRGDLALDAGLSVTGKSDSSLKASVASLKPLGELLATSCGLELNEVFIMYSHNRNYLITNSKNVNPNMGDYFDFFWGERRSQQCSLTRV